MTKIHDSILTLNQDVLMNDSEIHQYFCFGSIWTIDAKDNQEQDMTNKTIFYAIFLKNSEILLPLLVFYL